METEISATRFADTKKPLSAHTLSVINSSVPMVHARLQELTQARDKMGPGDPGRELLQRRIDLAEADLGALMNVLDLPPGESKFSARLKQLDKLLSSEARSSLESLHFQERHKAEIGIVELQILYNEIVKARPGFAQEATREGMRAYFNAEVRARVQSDMAKARAAGKSDRAVRDIGMKTARDLLTKTPTHSMRGYGAEGQYVEQYNLNPDLVSSRGLLYKLEKGATTYDAAGVAFSEGRGAVSARGVPAPLELKVEQVRNAKKKLVDVLVVRDANGREIARQDAETGQVRVVRKGIDVWLVSIKATNDAVITQMTKATGTPEAPTGHELVISPDTSTALQKKIEKAQENVADIQTAVKRGATHRQGSLAAAKKKLAQLEFISENVTVVDKASHTRLDTVIEALKEELVDVDAIIKDIKKGTF
jgi:hypothetical protein